MMKIATTDRKATADKVARTRLPLVSCLSTAVWENPGVRDDGALVVHRWALATGWCSS
jgi:hypothetical protein